MKAILYLLLAVLALPMALPLAAAPDRFEKKEAAAWVKEEMGRLKKTLAILKRVKDEKSADKAGKALLALYEVEREQTAMGEVGPARKPEGEAMMEAEEKNAKALEKMQKAIDSQCLRIAALELESPTLAKGLAAMAEATEPAEPSAASLDEPAAE